MTRRRKIWTTGIATAILLLVVGCASTPLRRSEGNIQNWVLQKAPLGSSVADVKAVIKSQGWRLDFEGEGTNSPTSPKDYPYVRGKHIIWAYFGSYQGIPWHADVDAFWGFDDAGKLIDFHVRKDYNAL
jgi:hypothetical protein